jgi:hypothetical protein
MALWSGVGESKQSATRFPKILEQQQQLVRINGRFLESEVLIETPGRIVDGVNEHRSDAYDVRSFFDARHASKSKALPSPLPCCL